MTLQHKQTALTIFTIGHSTHSIEEFVEMLKAHDIKLIVDVRTIPKSRHNPQYNSVTLAAALQKRAIGYKHLPGLGGFAMRRRIRSIRPGKTLHSGDLRIICKQKNSRQA